TGARRTEGPTNPNSTGARRTEGPTNPNNTDARRTEGPTSPNNTGAKRTEGPTSPNSTGASRILVVDDEPAIRELVTTVLRYEGFEVATAETGRNALAAVEANRPHLVVLDVMLP